MACGVLAGVLARSAERERVTLWFSEASLASLSREVERANLVLEAGGW